MEAEPPEFRSQAEPGNEKKNGCFLTFYEFIKIELWVGTIYTCQMLDYKVFLDTRFDHLLHPILVISVDIRVYIILMPDQQFSLWLFLIYFSRSQALSCNKKKLTTTQDIRRNIIGNQRKPAWLEQMLLSHPRA